MTARVDVIQYTGGGVPDDPMVFLDAESAERCWRSIVREWAHDGNPMFDYTGKPMTPDEALSAGYITDDSEATNEWRHYQGIEVTP